MFHTTPARERNGLQMVKRKEKLLILFLALVLFGGTVLFFPVTGSAAGGWDGSIASSFAATVYGNYTPTPASS